MADLYGTPPDSEEMSNILSQLLHGSSASSSCMPFKSTNMHLLHSPPAPHTTSSNEGHHRLAVVESSSDFNFSESGGYFTTGIMDSDANTSLRGRRISSENDLGHVTCDSEGPVAPEVPLNAAGPRSSSKRSRAAEVHNLSEKRRRSKINEKMKALQNLIPNSNKTDKASMLDEAIEYLKQLQLQVQMLTMRNGLSLHPMCLPGAAQPMQLPHIGLGFEEGSEGSHKVPKSDRGINPYYGNEENSIHYAYNTSGGCTISNHSTVMPAVGNVLTSEATFGFELEPSNQAHYRPFSIATSSQEVFSDSEPPSKSDSNRSGKNASADADKLSSKRPDA